MPDDAGRLRAFVLHPHIQKAAGRRDPQRALEEAVALARALPEIEVVGSDIVHLARAQPGLLFGRGKVDDLAEFFRGEGIGLVLVDGPVTPVQQRNLEERWGLKLLDRTGLILEIFADRAQTREGVLQVELAALSYQRTRLVRAWTHLERQRGGLGFVGGPGETQIEADRRAIDEAITRLRRQLGKVVKTRNLHRAARAKVPYPVVALVGYTNAGKSTLFNQLTGASVVAEDMLFATLDPTMRAVTLPSGAEVILSDTVGFISDLPTQLVAAFRATLEEVRSADLICHVRDISHVESEEQAADVHRILEDLNIDDCVPMLELWNKIDVVDPEERQTLETIAARSDGILTLSALGGEGLAELTRCIDDALDAGRQAEEVRLPFTDGKARAWLFDQGVVSHEREADDGWHLSVEWNALQKSRFEKITRA